MRIKFDRSKDTVLALCSCGWREIRGSQASADAAALEHIDRAHAGPDIDFRAFRHRATRRRDS